MERIIRAVGVGAGGHARAVIDAARLQGVEVVALVDADPARRGTTLAGVPVVGDDGALAGLRAQATHAFVGVGTVGRSAVRERLFALISASGLAPLDVVHPAAIVAADAAWGPGVTVLARAVLNPNARLGANVVVNTGSIVEHDCEVGDHVHLATGAILCGTVRVGPGAHVGAGAVVRQGVRVGARAVVGAGAVVVRDVPDDTVVVGVPARPLREQR